ncbi:MAG: hypothetical protein JNJ91_00370 [Flavobacteriales bacterium]|nr:hypothetical protein [Flavobacteriales bacterium]
MKARYTLFLLLIGSVLFVSGSLSRLVHIPLALANVQLLIGSIVQALALIMITTKALRYPGFKDFLDS